METVLKVYQCYSRFKSIPREIASIAPHLPSALVRHAFEDYDKDTVPGTVPDTVPGTVPDTVPDTVHDTVHDTVPGTVSGASEVKPLVVLIHGTNGGSWQWIVARQYLASAGFQTRCLTYASENRVTDSFSALTGALHKLLGSFPGRDFVLIGHSQGGLLARMLYKHCKGQKALPCSKVFILHAPQKGTSAARLWNGLRKSMGLSVQESLEDMEDGTEFAEYYREHCVDPDDPGVYESAGSLDYVREEEALFSSLPDNRYVGHYGHYSPMVNKSLWFTFIIPNLEESRPRESNSLRT